MEKSTRLLAHKVGPPVAVPISSVPVASVANFIYLSALYSSSCLILHLIKEGYTGIQINDLGFHRISLDMSAETYYNLYNSLKAITMFLGELFIN